VFIVSVLRERARETGEIQSEGECVCRFDNNNRRIFTPADPSQDEEDELEPEAEQHQDLHRLVIP
jgi:hypothetical protein